MDDSEVEGSATRGGKVQPAVNMSNASNGQLSSVQVSSLSAPSASGQGTGEEDKNNDGDTTIVAEDVTIGYDGDDGAKDGDNVRTIEETCLYSPFPPPSSKAKKPFTVPNRARETIAAGALSPRKRSADSSADRDADEESEPSVKKAKGSLKSSLRSERFVSSVPDASSVDISDAGISASASSQRSDDSTDRVGLSAVTNMAESTSRISGSTPTTSVVSDLERTSRSRSNLSSSLPYKSTVSSESVSNRPKVLSERKLMPLAGGAVAIGHETRRVDTFKKALARMSTTGDTLVIGDSHLKGVSGAEVNDGVSMIHAGGLCFRATAEGLSDWCRVYSNFKKIIVCLGCNDYLHHSEAETFNGLSVLVFQLHRVFPEAKIEWVIPFTSPKLQKMGFKEEEWTKCLKRGIKLYTGRDPIVHSNINAFDLGISVFHCSRNGGPPLHLKNVEGPRLMTNLLRRCLNLPSLSTFAPAPLPSFNAWGISTGSPKRLNSATWGVAAKASPLKTPTKSKVQNFQKVPPSKLEQLERLWNIITG